MTVGLEAIASCWAADEFGLALCVVANWQLDIGACLYQWIRCTREAFVLLDLWRVQMRDENTLCYVRECFICSIVDTVCLQHASHRYKYSWSRMGTVGEIVGPSEIHFFFETS